MRYSGGPFDGQETEAQPGPGQVDVLGRSEIDGRWHTVSHIYEVAEDGATAFYQFSQFEVEP
jgi:hypothetical protein